MAKSKEPEAINNWCNNLWYPEIYKSKQREISFNNWFGLEYFEELQLIRDRFHKYPKCRIIYFLYDVDID